MNRMDGKPEYEMADLNALLSPTPILERSVPVKAKDAKHSKQHITVVHNYHDHSADVHCEARRLPARGGVVTPFPLKLHAMLEAVEKENLEHVVSWQPHGRCFVVHDQKEFVNILDKYFKVSKVSSFQRQLNLYGFQRLTKGRDKSAYYHELFLRGRVFLAHSIQRIKVKGTKIRARANPDQEPNFYDMPFVHGNSATLPEQGQPAMKAESLIIEPLPMKIPADMWDLQETPIEPIPEDMWKGEDKMAAEVDEFFQDFDFPTDLNVFSEIENDDVFGDLLEQIIAC